MCKAGSTLLLFKAHVDFTPQRGAVHGQIK